VLRLSSEILHWFVAHLDADLACDNAIACIGSPAAQQPQPAWMADAWRLPLLPSRIELPVPAAIGRVLLQILEADWTSTSVRGVCLGGQAEADEDASDPELMAEEAGAAGDTDEVSSRRRSHSCMAGRSHF
jgi:hypothetical protein